MAHRVIDVLTYIMLDQELDAALDRVLTAQHDGEFEGQRWPFNRELTEEAMRFLTSRTLRRSQGRIM